MNEILVFLKNLKMKFYFLLWKQGKGHLLETIFDSF